MLRILIVLLLSYSSCISARMYQWVDPESGSTQLSGKPPMWYRNAESGPRVFVFENTKLIDDTNVSVSEEDRARLRQSAFLQAEEDRALAKEKVLKSKRMDAALAQKQQLEDAKAGEDEPALDELAQAMSEPEQVSPAEEPPTIEQMRKLISDWESATTEKARGLLERQDTSAR